MVSKKQDYEKAYQLYQKDKSLDKGMMLAKLDIAPPVYFCTVEPNTESEEKRLHYALECLQREDPSLRVLIDDEENFGQTLIQGMGELHLEIIKNRILNEYKLKAYFGPLNIAFKEKSTLNVSEPISFEKMIGEKKINVKLELDLNVRKNFKFDEVTVDIKDKLKASKEIPQEFLNAINHGIRSALNKGTQN